MKRYEDEIIQAEIDELTKELDENEDDDDKSAAILKKIQALRAKLS